MIIRYIITTTSGHRIADPATGVDGWESREAADAALADMAARGVLDPDEYVVTVKVEA